MKEKFVIPKEVVAATEQLSRGGFEVFLVGGCVRNLLMKLEAKDWDITTNAKPEEIQKLFLNSFYENKFGTVGVKSDVGVIEITTYRKEEQYSDKRHPDKISFTSKLEDDLARRDFTINAIAMSGAEEIRDPFNGQYDIKSKIIRAVGNPRDRFSEDALRLMRAARFATVLDFKIETQTEKAIKEKANLLEFISKERIRDELIHIFMSSHPWRGFELLHKLGLLAHVLPEVKEGVNVSQNKHHIYTVWEHNMRALQYAADEGWSLEVRLASLLHDVGKPRTKEGDGSDSTFYGHEIIGGQMAFEALSRLKFPQSVVKKVSKLVRYHLFYYNVDEVGESSVRRLIRRVGPEYMEDLIRVRMADRIGSGVPKAEPYKLRHFKFLIEKLQRDPISVRQLSINGDDVMRLTGTQPSPKIGALLAVLLEEILDDPRLNTREYLEERVQTLAKLSDKELENLGKKAKQKTVALEESEVGKIKQKHWVK